MLRAKIPSRSSPTAKTKYGDYKNDLRADFNQRCGYCDDSDEHYGFAMGFHIDHFAPQKDFPHLKTTYSNLVYACPVCNRAKSAKWIGDDENVSHDGTNGFVDPCSEEFDEHLDRLPNGVIVPLTPVGAYKVRELKLNLLRHQMNWQLQTLEGLMAELNSLSSIASQHEEGLVRLNNAIANVTGYYIEVKERRRASH